MLFKFDEINFLDVSLAFVVRGWDEVDALERACWSIEVVDLFLFSDFDDEMW
jgi:hypothetical protein